MGDRYETVKVAAVQAASVFLDRAASTDKACSLTREVARNGARVIGFPEGFIPAHPVWYHHYNRPDVFQLHANRAAPQLYHVHNAEHEVLFGRADAPALSPPAPRLTGPDLPEGE